MVIVYIKITQFKEQNMKSKPHVIACAVLARDIKEVAREMGLEPVYKFLEAGLHENPYKLNTRVQEAIDQISGQGDADRIIIGYGICGKGTVGLTSRDIPLVIPRVHDCIALFLGGDAAYQEQFKTYPGTYYLSAGWCEEKAVPISQRRGRAWFGNRQLVYEDVKNAHGQTAANQTFAFLNSWQKNYQRAAFIETRSGQAAKYERMAKDMADEYGWRFERIKGDQDLIRQMLTVTESTPGVLVVPPGHTIAFDPVISSLTPSPEWEYAHETTGPQTVCVVSSDKPDTDAGLEIHTGLGIDAGGTYTDTVVYDLEHRTTCCKAKALTTKWDFTIGIENALRRLEPEQLAKVALVALSTTLATNAIVENEGQIVGMLLMPPPGLDDHTIAYSPKAVIQGGLDIAGREKTPVDPDQIKTIADRMIRNHGVTAFAVSGYAGAVNPAHELAVKQVLQDHTCLFVSCGHELSDTLNFETRAVTAMLNARIIPRLKHLLTDVEQVLDRFNITAPIVVVKGDGTLMDAAMAKKRPVETILSGPAASVAGARHLTGRTDALVVDMGGTTTDTAALKNNLVRLNQKGSKVGGRRTHVQALDIRTTGLGGDSLIALEKGEFSIGPGRVAPIAWLAQNRPGTDAALEYVKHHLNRFTLSTQKMQLITATGSMALSQLTPMEEKVMSLVTQRPWSIEELVTKTGVLTDAGLPLARLEERFAVQRCGLTFTDLLHIQGRFTRWDRAAAGAYCDFMARLAGMEMTDMISLLLGKGIRRLTLELLKRQLDDEIDPDGLTSCPVCQALIDNLMAGGSPDFQVRIDLKRPVIGIGAPIGFFLPDAARALGAEAILPKDADVANAIGAITSDVMVHRQIRITPGHQGGFMVEGIAGTRQFTKFDAADTFAKDTLVQKVRDLGRAAGTSCRTVTLSIKDKAPKTASGDPIFMERVIQATLTGRPDRVVRKAIPA
jgi:N-methylhydantoinase A/oxoprolinase/acetone carboxylase beta subunit